MTDQLFLDALNSYAQGDLELAGQKCSAALERPSVSNELTVRLIHLRLTATSLWWSVAPSEEVRATVGLARAAAERTTDETVKSLAANISGSFLIATDGLPAALQCFEEAVAHSQRANSPLAILESLGNLGHYGVGQDLDRGFATLLRASALCDEGLAMASPAEEPLVRMWRGRIIGLTGVAAFDQGRFGDAEVDLTRSLHELRSIGARDQVAAMANYYGQLLSATGRFEEAESLLSEALRLLEDDAGLSVHQGYNLGLLGKLYLEWGEPDRAADAIEAGWERVKRGRHLGILPLLRNYLGELLLVEDYVHRDIPRAKTLFYETVAECTRSGFQRSEIAALTLWARADLLSGDLDHADIVSSRAVERLDETGTLPALRSEEVYYWRSRARRAVGDVEGAQLWLLRARDTIEDKAASLLSQDLRHVYRSRVSLNQQILAELSRMRAFDAQDLRGPSESW